MEAENGESVDPTRTVLQSYLEVLYLCLDNMSKWTASDLHAAFEWALALHKISLDVDRAAALANIAQASSHCGLMRRAAAPAVGAGPLIHAPPPEFLAGSASRATFGTCTAS